MRSVAILTEESTSSITLPGLRKIALLRKLPVLQGRAMGTYGSAVTLVSSGSMASVLTHINLRAAFRFLPTAFSMYWVLGTADYGYHSTGRGRRLLSGTMFRFLI